MVQKLSFPVGAVLFIVLVIGAVGVYAYFGSQQRAGENPSVFGIPLVPPIFAQGGPPEFPDPEAGISAYIQVDPAIVDFNQITPLFSSLIDAGDNYVIGNTITGYLKYPPNGSYAVEVRLYADTNGFLVAYLADSEPTAFMFDWTTWDSSTSQVDTVLYKFLERAAAALGQPISPSQLSWYHWAHPTATHIAAAARKGTGNLFLKTPAGATLLEQPSYSFNAVGALNRSASLTLVRPDGTNEILVHDCPCRTAKVAELTGIIPNASYTFKISGNGPLKDDSFLGVVTTYTAP